MQINRKNGHFKNKNKQNITKVQNLIFANFNAVNWELH